MERTTQMEAQGKELREYLTRDGKAPFGEWLTSLKDAVARAKIRVRLDRLKLGNPGDCKSVGEGVQELRLDFGPGYRIYFGYDGNTMILLLCGGTKQAQARDIRKAQDYWQDYKERKHGYVITTLSR